MDRWRGREDEIASLRDAINAGIARAEDDDDAAEMDLMAGEGSGRIQSIEPAADLVRAITADAERVLAGSEEQRRAERAYP